MYSFLCFQKMLLVSYKTSIHVHCTLDVHHQNNIYNNIHIYNI